MLKNQTKPKPATKEYEMLIPVSPPIELPKKIFDPAYIKELENLNELNRIFLQDLENERRRETQKQHNILKKKNAR